MKKKLFCLICAAALLLSATACTADPVNEEPDENQTPQHRVSSEYSLEEYAKPLWYGDVVTNESVMFMETDDKVVLEKEPLEEGELLPFDVDIVLSKALLYPADEIYGVYSYDMQTEYIRGKDWELVDGRLVLCPGSSIPVMTLDIFYPEKNDGTAFSSDVEGYEFIMFGEGTVMTQWQVVVTYRHSSTWEGPRPTVQSDKIKRFIEKLEKGEEVTVVFYGDSITTGANSSGPMGITPNAPSFAQIITEYIALKYGYTVSKEADPFGFDLSPTPLSGEKVLHYVNTAVGGTTSAWGIVNLQERVIAYEPDLVLVAFGMNEGGESLSIFSSRINTLVGQIQQALPETETILVSTMLPHYRVKGFFGRQYRHWEVLEEIARNSTELDTSRIAMANVTEAHDYILNFKEYYEMTGNNVNHPNDFLARVYTGVILETMFGDYYEEPEKTETAN